MVLAATPVAGCGHGAWKETPPMAEQAGAGMTEQERDAQIRATIAQIETSWNGLMQAIAGIPEDRLTEPGAAGEWSVKDVIGHVAFWDEQAVAAAQRRLAGEPDQPVDWQALNEREAAARADRPLAELRDEMRQAHDRVLDTLRSLPRLAPVEAIGVCGCLSGDTYEHYDDHAADVRAWRERVGV